MTVVFGTVSNPTSYLLPPQCHRQGGATGAVCPGPPNSAGLVKIRFVRQSHSSLASIMAAFAVFLTQVSLLFCFLLYAADANNAQLLYVATAQSAS